MTKPSIWEWGLVGGGGVVGEQERQSQAETQSKWPEVRTEGLARKERRSEQGGRGRKRARDQLDMDSKASYRQERKWKEMGLEDRRKSQKTQEERREKERERERQREAWVYLLFPPMCLKVTDTLLGFKLRVVITYLI